MVLSFLTMLSSVLLCGSLIEDQPSEQEAQGGAVETAASSQPDQNTASQPASQQPAYGQQQQGYAPPPPPNYGYQQQPYYQQPAPYAAYGAPYGRPRGKNWAASFVVLIGAVIAIIAFFLNFFNVINISLFNAIEAVINYGSFDISMLPAFIIAASAIFALIIAFIKPALAMISFILSTGSLVYLYIALMDQIGMSGMNIDIFQFAGIGLWLTLVSILVFLVGSIMGMVKRR